MRSRFFIIFLGFIVASCQTAKVAGHKAEDATRADYMPVAYQDVPGWKGENFDEALGALRKSCAVLLKRPSSATVNPTAVAGTVGDWLFACNALNAKTPVAARSYFENYFTPYKINTPNGDQGLFTGYYEKIIRGSRTRTARYNVPIYKRPSDLVMVELGDFKPEWKGQRIGGSVIDGKLKPYADRKTIDNGALQNKHLELAWSDDADAVFFLHVQGSGRVIMEDGSVMRIGYDGQNGQPYKAIGRELIARGALTPETTSLETIRQWLIAHPSEAAQLRWTNPSYVFFKELPADDASGPLGAQGVALTPQRSLAIDPRFVPYGAPVFLDIAQPIQKDARLQRLMIAQDTGGAIRGPVRGDVFWGAGDWDSAAAKIAGVMKSRGSAYVLLPKTLQGQLSVVLPDAK